MNVFVYSGDHKATETLVPGNTATGFTSTLLTLPVGAYVVSGQTLVTNGTMETGDPPSSWTASGTATLASDAVNRTGSAGSAGIKITAGAASDYCYQDLTTVAGVKYRLRFYYKNTAGDIAQIRLTNDPGGTEADITVTKISTKAATAGAVDLASTTSFSTAQDYSFTALGTTTRLYLRAKTNTDVVWFDDVSVNAITDLGVGIGKHAVAALVVCESNAARFCIDGSVPTNSTEAEPNHGMYLAVGQSYEVTGKNQLDNFSVIDAVSGSACRIGVTYSY